MKPAEFPLILTVLLNDAGQRLDQYLAAQISEVSRARLQQLIEKGEVLVNGAAAKASLRLKGDEQITIIGPPQAPPLRAMAEEIPLDIVYEDDDLAVVNKPAGMMVHAGSGRDRRRAQSRHAGECAAASFQTALRSGWRVASGDRASSGSRDQRLDGGREER